MDITSLDVKHDGLKQAEKESKKRKFLQFKGVLSEKCDLFMCLQWKLLCHEFYTKGNVSL
jgi:hypothetical protein